MSKTSVDHNTLSSKEIINFRQVTELIELKKYKKALKICEQILKKHPTNGETLALKGYVLNLIDDKNKEEAFKYIKDGIKHNLSSSFCWYLYGCLYKNYKNYNEACKCFTKAIQLNKYDHKPLKEYCILLLYLNKYEQFKDIRIDIYNNTNKTLRDKAILIFAFHLLKEYMKCYVIIKQMEKELLYDTYNDLSQDEKHNLLVYIIEILLEGQMFKDCIYIMNTYKHFFLDKFWYNKLMGLLYLYENDFTQANLYFKKAFFYNYENLEILLLMLYTEREYYIVGGNLCEQPNRPTHNNGNGKDNDSDNVNDKRNESKHETLHTDANKNKTTLSSLFYLDYKNEHKPNKEVKIDKNVKVLLNDFILDTYGSNKNLKLLSYIEKNILNDYISHNLGMKQYDIYTIAEFNNFINSNKISEDKFKDGLDKPSMSVFEFIATLQEDIQKEDICEKKRCINENKDQNSNEESDNVVGTNCHHFNNIYWSKKLGVDLLYLCKKKFEKNINNLHFYKIKNLNDEEEACIEAYFSKLQKIYTNSNLIRLFPLYFYNENKFSYYVEKQIRSLCFQKCFSIFSFLKYFYTYKNIKIILFILHKYIDNYSKKKELVSFVDDYVGIKKNEKYIDDRHLDLLHGDTKSSFSDTTCITTDASTNTSKNTSTNTFTNSTNSIDKNSTNSNTFEKRECLTDDKDIKNIMDGIYTDEDSVVHSRSNNSFDLGLIQKMKEVNENDEDDKNEDD
uniref:N-alpha-acetyltransferase 15, NatA auxiliary subunit n=1 Tax=Piliocolobus tephrosceles TaxID=591936 RepID=A0A8C9HI61_9PRIM